MKQNPQLADLKGQKPKDAFSRALMNAQLQPQMNYRKSFTMDQESIDILNDVTVKLVKKRGKSVSASEALRVILAAFKNT